MRGSKVCFIRQLGFAVSDSDDRLYAPLMFQPRAIGAFLVVGVALQSPWVFLALSGVLLWSTLRPAYNPLDAIYNHVVAKRKGGPYLRSAPPPRRFAQGLAGTFALVIATALLLKAGAVGRAMEAMMSVAMLQIVIGRFCAAANVYHMLLRRLSIETGEVCVSRARR